MDKDPDIIISISGAHRGKGIIAAILAEALKKRNVQQIAHLDYDQETFNEMGKIINETDESNLGSATVLFVEFEEDYIDGAFDSDLIAKKITDENISSQPEGNSSSNEQNAVCD